MKSKLTNILPFVTEFQLCAFIFSLLSDINECSASAGVCNVNANCQNTPGSYLCSCKPGYSGDGKTCKGTHGIFNLTFSMQQHTSSEVTVIKYDKI